MLVNSTQLVNELYSVSQHWIVGTWEKKRKKRVLKCVVKFQNKVISANNTHWVLQVTSQSGAGVSINHPLLGTRLNESGNMIILRTKHMITMNELLQQRVALDSSTTQSWV